MPTTRQMSDRHEADLAEVLGGRVTRGSGNQHNDPTDGKHGYASQRYVFAWDGKSTFGASLAVNRLAWQKIVEQSRWARPMLPLRFYADARLTVAVDLAVVNLHDFAEMLDDANRVPQLEATIEELRDDIRHLLKKVER